MATQQLDLSDLDELIGGGGNAVTAAAPIASAAAPLFQPIAIPSLPPILQQLQQSATEIIDPWGECIPIDDPDALIDAYERVANFDAKLYAVKQKLREAIGKLTEGDAKTRRVQGKRRKAKVEFPGLKWDQSKLREAWHAYPALRDQCLKIDTIGVKLTEYKKLVNTTGAPEVETFRNIVTSAASESDALPTVKVEQ